MNYVDEVKKLERELAYRRLEDLDASERTLVNKQIVLLKEIKRIIWNADFIKRSDARERFKYCLGSGLDYELTAKRFETTVDSIRASLHFTNKNIGERIGTRTLSLIKEGYVEEADRILKEKSRDRVAEVNGMFHDDFVNLLPSQEFSAYKYCELETEINFLARYSTKGIEMALKEIDSSKLAALLFKLSNDSTYDGIQELGWATLN